MSDDDPRPAVDAGDVGDGAAAHRSWPVRIEDGILTAIIAAMVLLPVVDIISRLHPTLRGSVPSTILTVQQLTLWLALLGAGLAAREGRHLTLTRLAERLPGRAGVAARLLVAVASGAVAAMLVVASVEFVVSLRSLPMRIGGVPHWVWALALPIGFALVAIRLGVTCAPLGTRLRVVSALVVGAAGATLALLDDERRTLLGESIAWPAILLLVVATVLGSRLFALIGGAPLLLFMVAEVPISALPNAAYELSQRPMYTAIPLFTVAGYVLAEGGASKRLVRLFQALVGWLPGGLAIAAACVCAFFTAFTGGSGITILALGGLLLPALLGAGYGERYSLGLVTSSGSLGLLFPPSVPIILYAIVAGVPIEELFAGALLPGVLMVVAVAATGVAAGRKTTTRTRFAAREVGAALVEAKWEALLPVVVLGGLFGGYTTPLEASAITALYAIFISTLAHRELSLRSDLPRVLANTATLIGGVFLIIAVSLGLTSYLIDADVASLATGWAEQSLHGKLAFLLALNFFLLLVGCLMDIYSAIIVVVPLVTPIAALYGVDPVHLGVIFIANLELGYLTPPVGLNLFLASFRFERPLLEIYRATVMFFFILLATVLAITYIPWLTRVGQGLLTS